MCSKNSFNEGDRVRYRKEFFSCRGNSWYTTITGIVDTPFTTGAEIRWDDGSWGYASFKDLEEASQYELFQSGG
jgi:hypothetical protein